MKRRKVCLQVLVLTTLCAPTAAFGSNESWDKVSPLINQDTVLAARVDVDKIDVAAAVNKIAQLAKVDRNERSELDSRAKSLLQLKQRYSQLGGRDVFLLASVADILDQSPAMVCEVAGGHDASELSAFLQGESNGPRQPGQIICQPIAGFVLCGRQKTVDRYRQLVAANRPEFKETAGKLAESSVQIVVTVPESQRRVFQEVPRLPELLKDVRGEEVARGLNTIGVGLNVTPRASLQILIDCADAGIGDRGRQANRRRRADVGRPSRGQAATRRHQRCGETHGSRSKMGANLWFTCRRTAASRNSSVAWQSRCSELGKRRDGQSSMNHLKQIALALLNFESAWGSLPPSASYDDSGKQLLSWRVFMLPFIEEEALYNEFHLDEPWDSPHNKTLISKMPEAFSSPMSDLAEGKTRYLAPLGPETVFHGKEGTPYKQITDGTSKTILVVEVSPSKAVVWTKPEDVTIDADKPRASFLEDESSSFNAAFCDGSVRAIFAETGSKSLWAMFTKGAGRRCRVAPALSRTCKIARSTRGMATITPRRKRRG